MTLDVQPPDPPSLSDPQSRDGSDDDYRRKEIATVLTEGAWADGFEAWAASTDLVESEFDLLVRHELFEHLDFYLDPDSDEMRYHVPTPSDDAREALGSDDADDIESELDSLARMVAETLENDYLLQEE